MEVALESEKGASFFFGFKAAFPSVDQAFILDLLTHLELPDSFVSPPTLTRTIWCTLSWVAGVSEVSR
eukprot:7716029-Pyramimonas_sp.AAC.1